MSTLKTIEYITIQQITSGHLHIFNFNYIYFLQKKQLHALHRSTSKMRTPWSSRGAIQSFCGTSCSTCRTKARREFCESKKFRSPDSDSPKIRERKSPENITNQVYQGRCPFKKKSRKGGPKISEDCTRPWKWSFHETPNCTPPIASATLLVWQQTAWAWQKGENWIEKKTREKCFKNVKTKGFQVFPPVA